MIPSDESIDSRILDRLIDGELDDDERREWLLRLDSKPDGWRMCALAFLENQQWKRAMAPEATAVPVSTLSTRQRVIRSRVLPWMSTAAAALLAFALGWSARGPHRNDASLIVQNPQSPVQVAVQPTERPLPKSVLNPNPRPKIPPSTAPSYVQGHLEREGYRVEQRLILVPAKAQNGRKVAVPVEQVRVRFVGNRTI